MVERQEVEALLAVCEAGSPGWYGSTDQRTVAALCRAWLAVDAAEVVDIRTDGKNGGESALFGAAQRAGYYRHGTRLRIVPDELGGAGK